MPISIWPKPNALSSDRYFAFLSNPAPRPTLLAKDKLNRLTGVWGFCIEVIGYAGFEWDPANQPQCIHRKVMDLFGINNK